MALLLIPGFMLDADLWHLVEPGLAEFGPISHVDLSQGNTLESMARRALDQAPASFVLVGFSMGGHVAREIVRQQPSRVTALILIATSARGETDIQRQRRTAVNGSDGTAAFRGLNTSAVASSLHPDNVGNTQLISIIQAMGVRLGAEVFRRQSLLERKNGQSDLRQITCPTLVIAGDIDNLRSRDEALELHKGIDGSDFAVIQNTGHMIPLEAADALASEISGWIRKKRLGTFHSSGDGIRDW